MCEGEFRDSSPSLLGGMSTSIRREFAEGVAGGAVDETGARAEALCRWGLFLCPSRVLSAARFATVLRLTPCRVSGSFFAAAAILVLGIDQPPRKSLDRGEELPWQYEYVVGANCDTFRNRAGSGLALISSNRVDCHGSQPKQFLQRRCCCSSSDRRSD